MPSNTLSSWLDLEARFRSLASETALLGLRIDYQWGSSGVHWNLTGVDRSVKYQEVTAVSAIAGKLLQAALSSDNATHQLILAESKDLERWFMAVKELSGSFHTELSGKETDEHGNLVGHIHHGSAQPYCELSANLCLVLAKEAPIRDMRPWIIRFYEKHEKPVIGGVLLLFVTAILKCLKGILELLVTRG